MNFLCPESPRATAEIIAAQSAARLRELNRLMTLAERLAHLGHWRYDPRERQVERSPQASAILGVAPHEALPPQRILSLVDPRDRFGLLRSLARANRGEQDVGCRIRLTLRSGATRPVMIQAIADRNETGAPCLIGIVRDVTTEAAAEDKLIAARDEARAATRAKSEFLATMSHEIRTPMTGVLGMIDLIADAADEEERRQYLAAMRQSAQMLMAVLDDILDFSKVESGRVQIDCKPFDLAMLARQTVLMFERAASTKGVVLDLATEPGQSSLVVGDPLRIQQVISNLLSNAVKFTSSGRITLSLRARPSRPRVQRWRFAVRDTGIGIEARDLGRLFEPFVQLGERGFGGTGLGLAISRRLVEAMGGKAGVRSTRGRGSTFWFELALPMADSADSPAAPLPVAADAPGRPLHVLVAEDNPINQMLITAMVRRLGHRVTAVDNGRRASEAAQAMPFDCILMDMQMPELDGVQATRAIRESGGRNAHVPIVALTADAAPERRRFYENVSLTAFLTKPIECEKLNDLLAAVASAPPLAAGRAAPALSAVDHDQLDELRATLGEERLHTLLEMLDAELVERPVTLRSLARSEDVTSLRNEAHSFKGAVASLGMSAVARTAKAVELSLPGPELELALDALDREVLRARLALKALLAADPEAAALSA